MSEHTEVSPAGADKYVVVARRYRPQRFDELVGQETVSQALQSAITTQRVGHAYLFTGARGVGKTSAARILAKALDCQSGPSPTPCNQCDICQSIAAGDDVDVLEIDEASNRGIDEIRQLRSNVSIRPSRAIYKIYIIDEVHMLTKEAFNALLKTLEEPPEHVKFIFCTTAPEKIPITVLSRCQRFDFAPVDVPAIVTRLQHIVASEGAEAETEALKLLARRAAGSMRDSQSLLEQLLSFGGKKITVDNVHAMLGTARSSRLAALTKSLMERDAAAALGELDAALAEGVDVGQLAEQLLGVLRDMMAASVGCGADLMLTSAPAEFELLAEGARNWGLETILAAVQILDQAVARMRQSVHPRTLVEMAVVRIAHLEDLDELPALIAELKDVQSAPTAATPTRDSRAATPRQVKKKIAAVAAGPEADLGNEPPHQPTAQDADHAASPHFPLTPESAVDVWKRALAKLDDMTADCAGHFDSVATFAPNRLVVSFRSPYNSSKSFCERPERRAQLEQAVLAVAGQSPRLEFRLLEDSSPAAPVEQPVISQRQQQREAAEHPLVQEAVKLFGGDISRVEGSKHDQADSGS